jgi:hypothetical protein
MNTTSSPFEALLVDDRLAAVTGFAYVQCDVPAGMRLDQWHAARNRARRSAETRARRERREALVAHLRRWTGVR